MRSENSVRVGVCVCCLSTNQVYFCADLSPQTDNDLWPSPPPEVRWGERDFSVYLCCRGDRQDSTCQSVGGRVKGQSGATMKSSSSVWAVGFLMFSLCGNRSLIHSSTNDQRINKRSRWTNNDMICHCTEFETFCQKTHMDVKKYNFVYEAKHSSVCIKFKENNKSHISRNMKNNLQSLTKLKMIKGFTTCSFL